MKSLGIIGYGSFGSFLYRKLKSHLDIKIYDPEVAPPEGISAGFKDVAACDFVVLAIPVDGYDEVLSELKHIMSKTSVLVDISSVKTVPYEKIISELPDQSRVVLHPLFGPQSAEESFDGHVVVMCPDASTPVPYKVVKEFILSLGLKVEEMIPEEHDNEMALVHALTFFVARSLLNMGVTETRLQTPTFRKLLDLVDLEKHHSEDLFRTIQLANPFAGAVRSKFIEKVVSLNSEL
jgi:prephenate dehydrogenase